MKSSREKLDAECDFRPVKNAPAAILTRIHVARESIDRQKQHARDRGFEYVEVYGPLGFTEDAVHIFKTLASHPEMEGVWARLHGLFDDTKRCPDTWSFAHACYHVLSSWKYAPKRTRAEHKEHFSKIAADLMDVVHRILVEPEFGVIGNMAALMNPVDLVSDDDIKSLINDVNADPIDCQSIESESGAISWFRSCLYDRVPSLPNYAAWIAEEAVRIAEEQSISERPHGRTASRVYFTKHLSKWFREKYDKPMHEVVAGVASALFDEIVTADTVRKAAVSEPDISYPFRRGKIPFA